MAKLLLVCDYYLYSYKGKYYFKDKVASGFYERYLRVFEELRIANRVIEEKQLTPERYPIDDSRIEVYSIPIFHGPIEYLKKYFTVGKILEHVTEGCDAAILRLPCTAAQRIGNSIIKKRIPYAVEVVFDAHDGAKTSANMMEKILWTLIDKKMRKICRHADGVSCVTQFYLQQRYFSTKPNHFESYYSSGGINSTFYSTPRSFPKNKIINIGHIDIQIGLHIRKGTDELLQAVALLKKENIDMNISFAGEDWADNAKRILKYAEKIGIGGCVSCPGLLNAKQISDFLDACDIFVLPTKAEGLPRVIIEAMAKGLPVVTTPNSGNPELVQPHYLVAYEDINTLSERIKELILDPDAYEKACLENFEKAKEYRADFLQLRRDLFYNKLKVLTK